MVPAARVVGDLLSVDRGQEWFLPGSVVGDLLSVDRGQEWFLAARVVGDLLSVDRGQEWFLLPAELVTCCLLTVARSGS